MEIDTASGWLDMATWVVSANCDARPHIDDVSLIVVHGISLPPGDFGGEGITQLFTNRLDIHAHPYYHRLAHTRVSAHLLIRRDGQTIQYVPFQLRAWHAGVSTYQGRKHCNDFSIGIELEGSDHIAYEDQQYQQLCAIIKVLCQTYPKLSNQTIVGHCDIARDRKTDPGPAFDWTRLQGLI